MSNLNSDLNSIIKLYGDFYNTIYTQAKQIYDLTKINLGNDIYLVYCTEHDNNQFSLKQNKNKKLIFDNSLNYGYLYKNNIKLSDITFRVGGSGGKYKDNYCKLLQYTKEYKHGNLCLVDIKGKIVLTENKGLSQHLSHVGGILALMDNYIYDLTTSKIIVKGKVIAITEEYIFILNEYDFKKEYNEGVYKINKNTAEYEYYK